MRDPFPLAKTTQPPYHPRLAAAPGTIDIQRADFPNQVQTNGPARGISSSVGVIEM